MTTASIFQFPGRAPAKGPWASQDLAEIYRVVDQFGRQGLVLEPSSGLSDEGDPWFALEDVTSGEALIHIARVDGMHVVIVLDGDSWQAARLRDAIDSMMAEAGSVLATSGVEAEEEGGADDAFGGFLRVVSAVMAVLSTDVILDAIRSPAMASGAQEGGDLSLGDVSTIADLRMDLPDTAVAVTATVKKADRSADAQMVQEARSPARSDDGDDVAADALAVWTMRGQLPEESGNQGPTLATAPVIDHIDLRAGMDRMLAEPTTKVPAIASGMGEALHLVNLAAAGTPLQATDKADTFFIQMTGDRKDVSLTIVGFERGVDSVVVETGTVSSTSSAIFFDPALLRLASTLTVIGQPPSGDSLGPGGA
ncbi:MAG: hypothetical protein RLY86_2245 [Pseudomonadota bacterium]|jgi:hypothetical protein